MERLACNGAQNKGTLLFHPPLHFKREHLKLANFCRTREKDKDTKEKQHCVFSNSEISIQEGGGEHLEF